MQLIFYTCRDIILTYFYFSIISETYILNIKIRHFLLNHPLELCIKMVFDFKFILKSKPPISSHDSAFLMIFLGLRHLEIRKWSSNSYFSWGTEAFILNLPPRPLNDLKYFHSSLVSPFSSIINTSTLTFIHLILFLVSQTQHLMYSLLCYCLNSKISLVSHLSRSIFSIAIFVTFTAEFITLLFFSFLEGTRMLKSLEFANKYVRLSAAIEIST